MPTAPPASSRLGRLLRLPLRLVPEGRELRILGGPLRGRRWISGSGTHGCWLGTYERALQRRFTDLLGRGDVLYDIGANAGFFTLLGASLVGDEGRVIAFEPLARNLDLLRRHLQLNRVTNAQVVPAAVAEGPGQGRLTGTGHPSQARLGSQGAPVEVVSVDHLVERAVIPAPSAMKIDVEGAESRALSGARATLRRHRPLIFLSAHGFRQQDACAALLGELGYSVQVWRDGSRDGQYESVAIHSRPG